MAGNWRQTNTGSNESGSYPPPTSSDVRKQMTSPDNYRSQGHSSLPQRQGQPLYFYCSPTANQGYLPPLCETSQWPPGQNTSFRGNTAYTYPVQGMTPQNNRCVQRDAPPYSAQGGGFPTQNITVDAQGVNQVQNPYFPGTLRTCNFGQSGTHSQLHPATSMDQVDDPRNRTSSSTPDLLTIRTATSSNTGSNPSYAKFQRDTKDSEKEIDDLTNKFSNYLTLGGKKAASEKLAEPRERVNKIFGHGSTVIGPEDGVKGQSAERGSQQAGHGNDIRQDGKPRLFSEGVGTDIRQDGKPRLSSEAVGIDIRQDGKPRLSSEAVGNDIRQDGKPRLSSEAVGTDIRQDGKPRLSSEAVGIDIRQDGKSRLSSEAVGNDISQDGKPRLSSEAVGNDIRQDGIPRLSPEAVGTDIKQEGKPRPSSEAVGTMEGTSVSSPHQHHTDTQYYTDRFMISGLNDTVVEDTLSNYVEVVSSCEVTKVEYSQDRSAAVITLMLERDQQSDWAQMVKAVAKKTLEGASVTVRRLSVSRSICVWNTSKENISDHLMKHFESTASGNKNKTPVSRLEAMDGYILITFEDPSPINSILSQPCHDVSGVQLVLSAYYEELGPVQRKVKPIVEEKIESFLEGEIRLLGVIGHLEFLKKDLDHLDEAYLDENTVFLKGEENDVAIAMQNLDKFRNEIRTKFMHCSEAMQDFLESKDGEKVLSRLKAKEVFVSWRISHDRLGIDLYAMSEGDLTETEKMINQLNEGTIPTKKSTMSSQDLKDHLIKKYDGKLFGLNRKQQELHVIAEKEIFSKLMDETKTFVCPEKTTAKFTECQDVRLSPEEFKFLSCCNQELVKNFVKKMSCEYQIHMKASDEKYSVTGNAKDVCDVCRQFENYVRKVLLKKEVRLDSKESETLQSVGQLSSLITHIEKTEKCVISKQVDEIFLPPEIYVDEEKFGAMGGAPLSERKSSEAGTRYDNGMSDGRGHSMESVSDSGQWTTVERKKGGKHGPTDSPQISLVKEEIAKVTADVIVNTVGAGMDLKGAVSTSVVKAGGFMLEQECKKGKDLKEGSYHMTGNGNGNLSCKKVFHCCLPFRKNIRSAEMFEAVVSKMLRDANKMKLKSIAFPALGTGVLGYDASFCAEILYTCVQRFCEKDLFLKDVKFVVWNKHVFQVFEKRDKMYRSQRTSERPGPAGTPRGLHTDVNHPKIKLISGELAKQTTEVIVNTSNSTLDLSQGAVSKSIWIAAGALIQYECKDFINRSGNLKNGSFAVTCGGMLACKKIYHCCLPSFTPAVIQLMSQMVHDILELATKYKTKDIAFPALGTGKLKYPPEKVAKAMFETVHKFGIDNPHTSLKEVRIVIYKDDAKVKKAFEDEEKHFMKLLTGSPRTGRDDSCRNKADPTHHSGVWNASSENIPIDVGPLLRVRIGLFEVQVREGDISLEKNTCIVNPIHHEMNLSVGSVSKALYKRGGKSFSDKTKAEKSSLSQDRVALVKLPDGTGVMHLDRKMIEENQRIAIVMCLKHARTEHYRSIAFPILQTGPVEKKMAEDLFEALMKAKYQQHCVSDVHVVIFNNTQAHAFCEKFSQLCKDSKVKEHSQSQITFTVLANRHDTLKAAESKLRSYCHSGRTYVKERIQIPVGIKKAELGSLGKQHDETNISFLDRNELELSGKPAAVYKALAAFYSFFNWKSPRKLQDFKSDDIISEDSLLGDGDTASGLPQKSTPITTGITSYPNDIAENTGSGHTSYNSQQDDVRDPEPGSCPGHQEKQVREREDGSLSFPPTDKPEFRPNTKENYGSTLSLEKNGDKKYNNVYGNSEMSRSEFSMDVEETGSSSGNRGAESVLASPNKMKWFYLDPDSDKLEAYDDNVSREIERSYLQNKDKHDLPEDADTRQRFLINFKTMEEYPESNRNDKVTVVRREEITADKGYQVPSSWEEMDKKKVKVVQLNMSDKAFKDVHEQITGSCGSLTVLVLKVERVQNVEIYGRYLAKKNIIDRECGKSETEKMLWYGCDDTDFIVPINNHGINLNNCRKENGGTIGEGLSFSAAFENIVKSDVERPQYAYLCRVLTGKYTKGESGLRDPPSQPGDDESSYHSVVDNINNPCTHMVFSDAQVYPHYLVTYKLTTENEKGAAKP